MPQSKEMNNNSIAYDFKILPLPVVIFRNRVDNHFLLSWGFCGTCGSIRSFMWRESWMLFSWLITTDNLYLCSACVKLLSKTCRCASMLNQPHFDRDMSNICVNTFLLRYFREFAHMHCNCVVIINSRWINLVYKYLV